MIGIREAWTVIQKSRFAFHHYKLSRAEARYGIAKLWTFEVEGSKWPKKAVSYLKNVKLATENDKKKLVSR